MENNEPPEALNEEEEAVQENGGGVDDDDPEMNSMQLLLRTETNNPRLNDQQAARIINDIWIQELRNFAVDYIVRTGMTELGFRGRPLYVSMMYLNRSLSSDRAYTAITNLSSSLVNPTRAYAIRVRVSAIMRLLAVVCLSLAAKMGEPNVPLLSQYPLGNFNLNVSDIRAMESMVLDDLNWNLNCVTPFAFAHFFRSRLNRHIPEDTRRRTNVLILRVAAVDVRSTNDQRPSVIGVAALLVVVNNHLTRQELEIEINALPLNRFLNIDNVWYCYNRFRVLNI